LKLSLITSYSIVKLASKWWVTPKYLIWAIVLDEIRRQNQGDISRRELNAAHIQAAAQVPSCHASI